MGLVVQTAEKISFEILIWFQKGWYHLEDSGMAIAIEHEIMDSVNLAHKKRLMADSGEHRN
jgi:hypothetical protein